VEIPSNRITALLDCIEEMTGKVIIWSRFRYDIRKIEAELKKKYGPESTVTYFGDTTSDQREEAKKQFQTGDVRFFVGNPQTAGMGLTLHAATNVVYYANDFNLESRVQSEDRAHRIGQHHPVLYVDLMAPQTVDVHIVKTLQKKIELSAAALGEEVRRWLELSPRANDD
jgi:SNF2 family DNA or RNA helicase